MELSIEQIDEFNENGLLFVENLFSRDEISKLNNRLPDIMNERSEKHVPPWRMQKQDNSEHWMHAESSTSHLYVYICFHVVPSS